MTFAKFFQRSFLAAGLGFMPSAASSNEPVSAPSAHAQIFGSAASVKRLSGMEENLLRLGGRNSILVLSREDLVTRQEILQSRILHHMNISPLPVINQEEEAQRFQTLLESYKDIVSQSFLKPETLPDRIRSKLMHWALTEGAATAFRPDNGSACIIVAPDGDVSPQELMTGLAGLPQSMSGLIRTSLTTEEIYALVMRHEAAHCSQEAPIESADRITRSVQNLGNEIDADDRAYADLRASMADHDRAEQIIQKFRMVRTMANLRNGGNFLTGMNYLSHGASSLHLHGEEKTEKSHADIILNAMTIGTMNDLTTGVTYGMTAAMTTQDPRFIEFLRNDPMNSIASDNRVFASLNFARVGSFINQEYPWIQYAGLRAMRDVILPVLNISFDNQSGRQNLSMLDDYINAFDQMIPGAPGHPVVQSHMELIRTYIPTILQSMARPSEPTLPEPVTGHFAACRNDTSASTGSEAVLRNIETFQKCMDEAKDRTRADLDRQFSLPQRPGAGRAPASR